MFLVQSLSMEHQFHLQSTLSVGLIMAYIDANFKTPVVENLENSTSQLLVSVTVTSSKFASKPPALCPTDPAKVNRDVPIPSPQPGTTNGRALPGTEPNILNVPVGREAVQLYCPTTGEELPNTMWFRSGIQVTPMPPRITITTTTLSGGILARVLTIRNVTASDLVEYECRTRNRAGSDVGRVTLQGMLCV